MKKILLILSLLLTMAGAADAAELDKPKINPKSGIVNVSGTLGEEFAERRVTLFVKDSADGTINWFDSVKCTENGGYSFDYLMKGINGNSYTAYVSVENSDMRFNSSFVFYNAAEEGPKLWQKILTGKPTKDASVIKGIIDTRSEFLGLDLSVYNGLSDEAKDKVCQSMYDVLNEITDFKPMLTEVSEVWALNSLADENIDLFISGFETLKNGETESTDKIMKSLPENVRSDIYSAMIGIDYTNKQAMLDDYKQRVILTAANSAAGWGEMATVIQTVSDVLEIDLTKYNLLKNKIAPISSMLKTYTDLESITKAFNDAVEEQYSQEIRQSYTPPVGGGTKSSISNSKIVLSPSVQEDENKEENKAFSDISEAEWAKDSITALKKRGIVSGDNGRFYPNNYITRAEFVTMLMCAFDFNENNGRGFSFYDVASDAWYYNFIKNAYENDIINGMSENYFCPQDNITRQDMAVVIYNAASKKTNISAVTPSFIDNTSISDYAKDAVGALSANGIISGFEDNSFRPRENATRAQAAVMISNIISFAEKDSN